MTKVDLVTGFLGAGKTTFIKEYVRYWNRKGKRVKIIENEFGAVSVDTKLLGQEECEMEDLTGCCMCCTGKEKFITMLYRGAQDGFDRILVEPSGIYDVDEFFEVIHKLQSLQNAGCEIGSILTIVDPKPLDGFSEESKYLLYAQLLAAGCVVFSKVQEASVQELESAKKELADLVTSFGSSLQDFNTLEKPWEELTDEDFQRLSESGFHHAAHIRRAMRHDEIYMSYMTADYCENRQDLERRIDALFTDPSFGDVIRVKGYVRDLDKKLYEINCTRQNRSIRPVDQKRGVCIIIGQNLKEDILKEKAFFPRK